MRKILILILAAGALSSSSLAYAQIDTRGLVKTQISPILNITDTIGYLKIEGIDGEASNSQYKNWIGVKDYSFAVEAAPSSGGRSGGRAEFADFIIVKSVDKATPDLAIHVANGKHIAKIEFEIKKEGRQYLVEMSDVIITSVNTGNYGSDWPQEQVGFRYGKIKWTYKTGNGVSTDRTWDIARNRQE